MGREWLRSGSSSGSTSSPFSKRDFKQERSNAAAPAPPPGCMSGVLHYLQFHHFLFNAGSSRSPPAAPSPVDLARLEQLRGFEAPRNSLELDEGTSSSMAAASAVEDEFYDVHVAIEISSAEGKARSQQQQVETPRGTPGIVARLMGLEISLDHASSPTTAKMPALPLQQPQVLGGKKMKKTRSKRSFDGDLRCRAMREHECSPSPRQPLRSLDRNVVAAPSSSAGSRSLPETPRVSLSSARSCDEYPPRLSLQLNKENNVTAEYHSLPPSPSAYAAVKTKKRDFGRHQDENKSPRSRRYAREIVEEVREAVASRRGDSGRLDAEIKSESKRTRKTTTTTTTTTMENKKIAMAADAPIFPPRSPLQLVSSKDNEGTKRPRETTKMVLTKCRKADNERFTDRIRRQETQATTTTLASLFRSADMQRSAGKNLNPDKSRSQPVSGAPPVNSPATPCSTPTLGLAECELKRDGSQGRLWRSEGPEFRYVKSIFERAGIAGVRSLRWSSPLQPVDPIVFDELEFELPSSTGHLRFRWNRKLLFYLVEEILGDLLLIRPDDPLPSSTAVHHLDRDSTSAESLLRRVWGQIESFPHEGCVDLHALISRDLPEANVRRLLRHPSVVEEAEDVMLEVEGEILDGLVGETAATLALALSSSCSSTQGGGGGGTGVRPPRNLSRCC